MNQLIFWDENTLLEVYKGKINNYKHKKLKKVKIKKDFSLVEINKYLIAKWYIKIIDWQNTFILENLIDEKWNNIWIKQIDEDFKQNMKKIIKLKKNKSNINLIKEKIEIQTFSKKTKSKDLLLKYREKLFSLELIKKELIKDTFLYSDYIELTK